MPMNFRFLTAFLGGLLIAGSAFCQTALYKKVDSQIQGLEADVIAWRRDIHQNPELSNREFKTAEKVAEHLRSLGMEVQTGVAHSRNS